MVLLDEKKSYLGIPQENVLLCNNLCPVCTHIQVALIHHIYINCWLPVYRLSAMDKKVTNTPPHTWKWGGGGVLVTCIYITDHL